MARRKLIKYETGVYHVTAKTNNSDWFPIPPKDCWFLIGYYINEISLRYNIKIHAFTLMSNHFHLLCSTPDKNLDKAMNYFMSMTSKGIGFASGKKNHLWGNKYFWTYADNSIGYAALFKYILRNPVRAKITQDIQSYPWSTYSLNHFKFEISGNDLDELIPRDNIENWLNFCDKEFDEKTHFNQILRRKNFKAPTVRSSRKQVDFDLYI